MSAARSKATLLGTALLAAPLSAQAWIDDDPATDWTALTLHRNEWRLGLFRFQYGIVDSLQVGTQTLPWVLKISNLDLKWTVWSSGPWSVGLSGGIFSLKLQDYDADAADVRFYAAPLELTASWRGDGLGVHLRGSYIHVVKPEWGVSAQLRARYYHSTEPGEFDYYSPRDYLQLLPMLQLRRFDGGWEYRAQAAYGGQRATGAGWFDSRYANLRVTSPRWDRGWELQAEATYSNTSATSGPDYDYVMGRLGIAWAF